MPHDLYLLAGRYRLIERLGQGGAGTVWRAIDEMLDRQVAVKQVRVPDGLTPDERARFTGRAIHEARSAGRLRDPAIVLVHDVVLEGHQPWIIMDLVTGRSLDQLIKERGPLPPGAVARIGLRVLSALEVAHAHGMLHQDVKPGNILLDADGSAMLTDFGIAAPMGGQGGQGEPAGTAGSPGYMAPERLNEQPSGPASDLWSLGASLYTAVEGRAPFERDLPAAVTAAVLLHEPPFPARAGRRLGGLLMAMLAKNPAARPTAPQIRQALTPLVDAAPEPRGRPRWLLPAALGAAAVVLLGAGGWYALSALRPQPDAGRYAAAPDPCTLLTDAQAAELTKVAPTRNASRPGECQWIVREEPGRTLTVRAWAEKPDGDLGGPQVAQRRFASEKATRAAGKGQEGRGVRGGVSEVPGIAEAAILQNSFTFYINTNKTGRSDSVLLFRTSNLLGEVVWHREDVPASRAADKETAVAAARLVAAALNR
ncbi:Serine/threonine-protein kinase PknK [Nonomuraea coxensis DSM 45129]|uniref:non-specific serine/threonine protein kinase n=1 Tax=Nonomuraea coxensis DSM 45129 TaxID=1122611 RepID=A0ABX8TYJ5_9ACTN|nr:serine/threonine-protein kinase [Nonomuraea coxensis]QYC40547.1 Serine/threonine-protein kinase PknK [Nonomuraea coxensis DSM 45129]